jgi:hypothetical protein
MFMLGVQLSQLEGLGRYSKPILHFVILTDNKCAGFKQDSSCLPATTTDGPVSRDDRNGCSTIRGGSNSCIVNNVGWTLETLPGKAFGKIQVTLYRQT